MISNRIVDLRFGPISNKYRLTDFVVQRGRAPEMIQPINSTHHFDDIAKMAGLFLHGCMSPASPRREGCLRLEPVLLLAVRREPSTFR
jgi:hypothetical protein